MLGGGKTRQEGIVEKTGEEERLGRIRCEDQGCE